MGGMGARRAPALLVVASGHIFSFFLLLGYCLTIRLHLPDQHSLLFALVGGFEGSIALAIFYRALAMGAMGLTAALTGVITAVVPVVFSFFTDGLPRPLSAGGLAAGLVAIWLITHAPQKDGASTPRAALMLGALAGTLFGAQLILFKIASPGGVVATMTAGRAAGGLAMVLVILVAPPKGEWKGFWAWGSWRDYWIQQGISSTCARRNWDGWMWLLLSVLFIPPAPSCWLPWCCASGPPPPITGMALALGAVVLLSL